MKKKAGSNLTLKKLSDLYEDVIKYYDPTEYTYPSWKYWIYKFQFWKYKEVLKGVFIKKH